VDLTPDPARRSSVISRLDLDAAASEPFDSGRRIECVDRGELPVLEITNIICADMFNDGPGIIEVQTSVAADLSPLPTQVSAYSLHSSLAGISITHLS